MSYLVVLAIPDLGPDRRDGFVAYDLITGEHWSRSEPNFVRVGPDTGPVHIVHVQQA